MLNRIFHSYAPFKGEIIGRRNGALISTDNGMAVAYALFNLQDRGLMFVSATDTCLSGHDCGRT